MSDPYFAPEPVSDLIFELPEVGTLEWFETMDSDTVYLQHETPADYRDDMADETDLLDDDDDSDDEEGFESSDEDEDVSLDASPPEPVLKYYRRKAPPVEDAPTEPKPRWDDRVGIAAEYPRGSKGWELGLKPAKAS